MPRVFSGRGSPKGDRERPLPLIARPAVDRAIRPSAEPSGRADRRRAFAFAMPQGGGDLLLGKPRTIVAFDEERGQAGAVDVKGPVQGLIEGAELLEQHPVLLE